MNAPEEIVSQLFAIRNFEGSYRTSLGADAGHHVANGSVLAGSVHALQDNQKSSFLYGIKQVLQIVEALDRFIEFGLGFLVIIMTKRIGGVGFSIDSFLFSVGPA